jgi:MFS transporter, DHA2 family, multidrug resistance protein
MIVLATSIPFVVTGVDPLLLSLNLLAIRQDLGIPSDLVGFTSSAATLVMAAVVLGVGNLGDLYGHKRLLNCRWSGQRTDQPCAVEKQKENSPDADQS